jgi:hypothetical protein
MIDICQKFADESSFQFSKEKSHVVVFSDQIDHPYKWTLNGDVMTEAYEYKYLGLIYHRSLGASSSSSIGAEYERFNGLKFINEDAEEDEERQIVVVRYNQEYKAWVGVTSRVDATDDDDDEEDVIEEYFLNGVMDKMVDRYSSKYGVTQKSVARPPGDPWFEQRQMILSKLKQKKGQLRRLGAIAYCMDVGFAKTIAKAMMLSTSLLGSEVWQMGLKQESFEVEFNEVYRSILGVERGTCLSAIRHELGVTTQHNLASAAALNFRNYVLGLPTSRIIRRVYDGLALEAKGKDKKSRNNAVVWFLEPLAREAGMVRAMTSNAAKYKAKKFVANKQDKVFDEDVLVRSTLIESRLKDLTCVRGGKVPEYLMEKCPIGLRRGRCMKAKLRNGCHDLRVSSSRKSGERRGVARLCTCCPLGMIETIEHFICYCPAFDSLRDEFWEVASSVVPGFSDLSSVEKLDCLLKDDTPARLRLRSYRFLMKMFDARSLVSK